MLEYVMDSSALLRFADDEPGAKRVEEIVKAGTSGTARISMSAVLWAEVAGRLRIHHGSQREAALLDALLPSEVEIIPATAERAVRVAYLKVDRKISYADAFAVELATQSPNHVLPTADCGLKAVEDLVQIEFLPAK